MKNKKLLKEIFTVEKRFNDIFNGDRIDIGQDGRILIAPCVECLNFIDLKSGQKIYELNSNNERKSQFTMDNNDDGKAEYIVTFAYNSSDQNLVIAYSSGLLRHYSLDINITNDNENDKIEINHSLQRTWKSMHIGSIASIRFDQTGTLIATGGSDGTIKLWNLIQKYCTHNFKNHIRGVIQTITFAPKFTTDSYQIFASGDDYGIHVWNLIDSKHLCVLEGHESKVTEILFTADHQYFISSSRDKLVIIWNWRTMQKYRTMAVYEAIETMILVSRKKFTEILKHSNQTDDDEQVLVVAGNSGLLKIWDWQNGHQLFAQQQSLLAIHQTEDKDTLSSSSSQQYTLINQLVYDSDSEQQQIVAVSYDKDIVFHDVSTLKPTRQLVGTNDEVLDVKFIGQSNRHIAVATNSPKIKVFDLETSSCSFLIGHNDIVLTLAVFACDRHLMISSSKDNSIRVWKFDPNDCHRACCVYRGTGHTHSITSLSTSILAGNLFFLSGSEDTTLKFWKLPSTIQSDSENIDDNKSIENLRSKYTQSCHEKTINSIDIAPNDQLVATGSQDRTAKLWSLPNLKLLSVFRGHRKGIWSVRFSPVDQILATGSADSTIKIWSIGSEQQTCLRTFQGHESSVLKLTFIDDGIQLLSSSSDGNLKIWSLQSNDCIATFDAHEGKVWAMDVTDDENTIVTGGDDSTIAIWIDRTEETKEKEQIRTEESVQNEQTLQNLLQKKNWTKALKMAIRFGHPLRCLIILKEMLLECSKTEILIENLVRLRRDQLLTLFDYSIHWNTNSKHWILAQCVIRACFEQISPEEMEKMPEFQMKITKLLPYCERHLSRIQRLRQMVTFVDFVFEQMKLPDNQ
ncbi:Transducin (beta)-like 3 [Dermatophagoides pteronyssinus]|uniref:Transducin beta-like protein 3 n=2 Tax=Dermatophagoides pteronyssinus TaxID=6956 RepID=A0A6P6YIH8_DERPT|nr:transducin beta-like protein 3 [Dermatophagoides pteronyssinus]KAH9426173.1 Transducin (beta)-like 3 [Dermatophagoides pteronyssinus]